MKRLICVFLAVLLCFGLASCNLAGTTVKVTTNSMEPTIRAGSVIRCEPVEHPETLAAGDIIAYWTVIDGERVSTVSRITSIYDGGGYLIFETKDDNANSVNPLTVHESEIIGVYKK
jgi:signal peptidase I